MDPITAGIVASAAAPVVGGILGNIAGGGARDASSDAMRKALDAIASVNLPDIEKQKLMLQLPQLMGEYKAKLEAPAAQLGTSQMQGIAVAPEIQNAQRQALESLTNLGQTGLTADEKVAMSQARREAAGLDEARQKAVLDEMAARGMGGSGNELIAKLKSGQNAADRAGLASENTLASAQRRALEAITGAGSLAGQQRGQDFSEEAQKAAAADLIAKFNLEHASDVGQRNVERQNQESLRNLNEQQRISEARTGVQNQQEQYNKGLQQQQFDNAMRRAGAASGAYQNQAQFQAGEANRIGNQFAQVGAGIGQMGAGLATHSAQQDAQNKNDEFQKSYLDILGGNKGQQQGPF